MQSAQTSAWHDVNTLLSYNITVMDWRGSNFEFSTPGCDTHIILQKQQIKKKVCRKLVLLHQEAHKGAPSQPPLGFGNSSTMSSAALSIPVCASRCTEGQFEFLNQVAVTRNQSEI